MVTCIWLSFRHGASLLSSAWPLDVMGGNFYANGFEGRRISPCTKVVRMGFNWSLTWLSYCISKQLFQRWRLLGTMFFSWVMDSLKPFAVLSHPPHRRWRGGWWWCDVGEGCGTSRRMWSLIWAFWELTKTTTTKERPTNTTELTRQITPPTPLFSPPRLLLSHYSWRVIHMQWPCVNPARHCATHLTALLRREYG